MVPTVGHSVRSDRRDTQLVTAASYPPNVTFRVLPAMLRTHVLTEVASRSELLVPAQTAASANTEGITARAG